MFNYQRASTLITRVYSISRTKRRCSKLCAIYNGLSTSHISPSVQKLWHNISIPEASLPWHALKMAIESSHFDRLVLFPYYILCIIILVHCTSSRAHNVWPTITVTVIGWAHKATLAPRPSDLLCLPVWVPMLNDLPTRGLWKLPSDT
jgi:hypothetical protein